MAKDYSVKINSKHLENALYRLRMDLLGYSGNEKDLDIEVSFTKEDPGTGSMVDCLTITGRKQIEDEDEGEGETSISIEIYPSSENQDPVASKTQTYKVKKKY
jgi:hypothetical protein